MGRRLTVGNKYEVYAWKKVSTGRRDAENYADVQVYGGESMLRATIAAIRAKRTCSYVHFEWR